MIETGRHKSIRKKILKNEKSWIQNSKSAPREILVEAETTPRLVSDD